jgi:hypothetical protein
LTSKSNIGPGTKDVGWSGQIDQFEEATNDAIGTAYTTLTSYQAATGEKDWSAVQLFSMRVTIDNWVSPSNTEDCTTCVRGQEDGGNATLYMKGILQTDAHFESLVRTIIHEFIHTTKENVDLQNAKGAYDQDYFQRPLEKDAFKRTDEIMKFYKPPE